MTARIFISYRAADGADKATALARELGRIFGDAAVFLDKEDLTAGRRWVDEVGKTLGLRPVVLLLVTPGLLAEGLRDAQDPVRRELVAALAAGAEVVPLLSDGVEALPAGLPPPLDTLPDRTWRRLRAYDWAADMQRLEQDLRRHGVAATTARSRRGLLIGAGAAVLAVAGAGLAWWWQRGPADRVAGRWIVRFGSEPPMVLVLRRRGETVRIESEPVDIRTRADWAEYRTFWRQRFGADLDAVRYRGEGRLLQALGTPTALDIGFRVLSVPGDQDIDGGNLSATVQPDGSLRGTRWLNGAQAEVAAQWRRR